MNSNPKHSKISLRRTQRRRRTATSKRKPHARACRVQRSIGNGGLTCSSKVSDKLEALKNLIPPCNNGTEIVKPDQLFQETADYIVHLRTQVFVLQKLIEFYGSSEKDNNAVL